MPNSQLESAGTVCSNCDYRSEVRSLSTNVRPKHKD